MISESDVLARLLSYHPNLPETRKFEYPWIIKRMTSPASVLDVGCDGSTFDKVLSDLGFNVTTMDIDPRAAYYWNGEERKNFILADARAPHPKLFGKSNYITIVSTLEHLEGNDDIKMVRELEKCLAHQGSIFITVPWGEGILRQGQWLVRGYSPESVDRITGTSLRLSCWTRSGDSLKSDLPIFCMELTKT